MTELYVVVLGIGEHIEGIAGVYENKERVRQAVADIERSGLWDDPDQWVNYQSHELVIDRPPWESEGEGEPRRELEAEELREHKKSHL